MFSFNNFEFFYATRFEVRFHTINLVALADGQFIPHLFAGLSGTLSGMHQCNWSLSCTKPSRDSSVLESNV